jgi:hypothetical protein
LVRLSPKKLRFSLENAVFSRFLVLPTLFGNGYNIDRPIRTIFSCRPIAIQRRKLNPSNGKHLAP